MSPVEACRECGALFPFLPRGVCSACIDLREQRYGEVREWLLDNRGASILRAAEVTGVAERLILEFISEGRLEFVSAEQHESRAEEELKERIRRDLATRAADGSAAQDSPAPRSLGMRSRER